MIYDLKSDKRFYYIAYIRPKILKNRVNSPYLDAPSSVIMRFIYYGNHVDWEKSETLMTSNAPMQQTAYGNWRFESQDLSYYGLSITHFDKYRTDPYSSYTEHTDKSETKEMTPGSNVTIWLTIKKK